MQRKTLIALYVFVILALTATAVTVVLLYGGVLKPQSGGGSSSGGGVPVSIGSGTPGLSVGNQVYDTSTNTLSLTLTYNGKIDNSSLKVKYTVFDAQGDYVTHIASKALTSSGLIVWDVQLPPAHPINIIGTVFVVS